MGVVDRAIENYAAGSANLEARAAIWQYTAPDHPVVPQDWFLDLVEWPSGAVALDVGCGSGRFLESIARRAATTLALDFSFQMALEVADSTPPACADVCALPLRDASVDIGLAAWILYHAYDIEQACHELRRVVRRSGALIVVTNGARHAFELTAAFDEAALRTGRSVVQPTISGERFTFDEAGFFLTRAFAEVTAHVRRRVLAVPSPDLIVGYLASVLPAELRHDEELLDAIHSVASERIERDGAFTVTGLSAAFVCR